MIKHRNRTHRAATQTAGRLLFHKITNRCQHMLKLWHIFRGIYLCGEIAACLELLEEGRHEDGGEEEDHTPEEHVGDVGAVGTTGGALELSMQHLALLLAPDDTVMVVITIGE